MNFNEGQIYQTTSGGAPEPNFFVYKNGQLQYVKDLGDQYTQQRGNQSGFDFAPTFRNQLSQQFGTPIQTIEANEVGDYASALRAQGRIAFQNPLSSSDLKSLLATPFSQTEAPINPQSRLSGQTNLPPQQFSNGVYQGTFAPGMAPQQNATGQAPQQQPIQNTVPVPGAAPGAVSGLTAQPGAPLANQVETNQPQFVRNTTTGQIAQVMPGGLKGFGTPQEFAAAGGDYNKVQNVSDADFQTRAGGHETATGTTGEKTSVPERGLADPSRGPNDFINTYANIIKSLGLTDIKSAFEQVQKEYTDLAKQKADEVQTINDNPWMTQGVRDANFAAINKKYETRELILTHKQTLYDALYKEGIQQAEFLATGEYNQQRDAAALAEKKREAIDKLKELRPSEFKEVQGGLYDIKNNKWIVQPREKSSANVEVFTKSQTQNGAANANISIEDFQKLDPDTQNYFINNGDRIKSVMKVIDKAKGDNGDPTQIEADINNSQAPSAVKDTLVRYLWSKFSRPSNHILPWWKRIF